MMPCDFCAPHHVDYGFQLNDVRADYIVPEAPNCSECPGDDYCEACGFEPEFSHVKVVVVREWITCPDCEQGTDFRVKYQAKGLPGGEACSSADEGAVHAFIKALCPKAELDDEPGGY